MDTLIVVPTSLIHQWKEEILKFSGFPIKILVYSEDERVDMSEDIRSFDIVIVSYNKLAYDFHKGDSKLHKAYWYRIILDEAHYIRNSRTKMAIGCQTLLGERRWCLTGTPIQNGIEDVYSLILFLNYSPWSERSWWTENIAQALEDPMRRSNALNLLKTIIGPIMLRRTKAQH